MRIGSKGADVMEAAYRILDEVRKEFAPDPRRAIFEVEIERDGPAIVIRGACSDPAAAEALHSRIAALDQDLTIRDELVRLPAASPGSATQAIVIAAIAPMLAGPVITESHLSQVLFGHRVTVLREDGRWLHCRSEDGYLGWIHRGYLLRVSDEAAGAWEMGTVAPVHLSLGADVLDEDGQTRVRLPWGARVGVDDGVAVLPGGGRGTVRGELVPLIHLRDRFPASGPAIVATARSWHGVPYIWGGTTLWGADCSGLVQATFRMHGTELPRDSDQQATVGIELPLRDDLDHLCPADLLFFAEPPDPISHVAISMGGSRIVHCSLGNGGVATNDLLGASGYERELRSLLVAIRRIIPEE